MLIKLSVVAGPHTGREFPFETRDTFLVGQTADCHFRLPDNDPYVSNRHLLIDVNPPRCRVIDLNSRRGIKVNGERVESAELNDGDEVRAGQTVFKLTVPPAPAERRKPAAFSSLTPATRTEQPLALPVIPGYVLDKEIGRGGIGVVYRGTRRADGMRVVVKTILPAPGIGAAAVEKFLAEVRALTSLRHPNIVEVFDAGIVGRLVYVVTENVNGANAEQIVNYRGPLSIRTAVVMVAHALAGLGRLHARGKVHRDVKPTNLVIGTSGDKKAAKVTDIGLSRAYLDANLGGLTLQGEASGISPFAAPEQITHPRTAGPAADQYSAAAILYYLLTGSPPHDLPESPAKAISTILTQDAVPIRERRADLPDGLVTAIQTALHRDLEARYARADHFRQALVKEMPAAPTAVGEAVC